MKEFEKGDHVVAEYGGELLDSMVRWMKKLALFKLSYDVD